MAQMAPLLWANLTITFIMIFLIMSSLNYFSFMYTNKMDKKSDMKYSINWKW